MDMWMFYLIHVYLSSTLFSSVMSYNSQKFKSVENLGSNLVEHNGNVLWNTEPPTITNQIPMSITFDSNEVLRLHCNITGYPRPTYQWYVSSKELAENTEHIQDHNFEKIESGTGYTWDVDGRVDKKTYSKYIYYCSARNAFGVLHSNKIVVEKVTRPAQISVKYIFHPVFEGEKFVAQCQLVPDLIPLYKFKYWEIRLKLEKPLHLNHTVGRYSVIHSTKFPQLHIRNVTNEDFITTKIRGVFQSTISNRQDIVYGSPKSIKKSQSGDAPYYVKLSCTDETLTTAVGTNIELPWGSVPRTLIVYWHKINNLHPKKKVEIVNKENNTRFFINRRFGNLLILNVTKEDAGVYTVESYPKKLSIKYILKIYETPYISLNPINIRKSLSESAEFICGSTFAKNQFQWLHNGNVVVDGYHDGTVEVITSHNVSTLRIKEVHLSTSGIFQCIVTFLDELKSLSDYRQISGTLLISEVPPRLIKQSPRAEKDSSIAQIQMSAMKQVQTIECVFAASPKPKIEWYHNFDLIAIEDKIIIRTEQDKNSIYNVITRMVISFDKDANGAKEKYAGEYQARASNSLGSTSCNTLLLRDGNMDIRLPVTHTAISGSNFLMTCFFIAMEVPEFSWDRRIVGRKTWETLPINHRTIIIEKGYRLLIKDVMRAEDAGEYRCTVKYNKETKSGFTHLIVVYPPIIHILPSKHDASQFQSHICSIRSADKPWYAWWTFTKYDSNETIEISPNLKYKMFSVVYNAIRSSNGKSLDGVPAFVVKYPNVSVDIKIKARPHGADSFGKFICHVKNKIGYDEKIIKDIFLSLEFNIIPPRSSEVIVGKDLYLDCTAVESELNPIVKWRLLNEDRQYVDVNEIKKEHNDRIFQYDNGTLVMKSIKESDPSKLTCFIFPTGNSDNVQSKIAYIEIKVPARVHPLKKRVFKVAGTSFNISCDVYGHTNKMNVTWYHRSSNVGQWGVLHVTCFYSNERQCLSQYETNSGKFTHIKEIHNRTFNTVHLEFRDATKLISGQYKCEAINKFNARSDQSSMTLTIISRPTAVIMDSVPKEHSSSSVSFDWKPPESDGNKPILHYVIRYYEISSYSNNQKLPKMIQKTIRVNASQHSIVIDQLRPHKKYRVSVVAENAVGASEEATMDVVTEEAKPQKSVNNLAASSNEPHEILILWDEPDPEYQNGRIIQYQMCYQTFPPIMESKAATLPETLNWPDNSADINQYPRVKCEYTKNKTITVSHLPQFTDFAIRVIAFNSKGDSPALFTKVRTLEDLPRSPPVRVTCEGQHQQISIQWDPPERVTINGVLKGYMVYYYQPNKYRDESEMKSVSVQERTSVTIDQLKPYTAYSIQIMAVNRKGFGPPSHSVVCHTKEAKAEAPELVKASKINRTCTYVSWLHTLNPNGHIREYCVEGVGRYPNSKRCQPPDMSKRYNAMLRCDFYGDFSTVRVYARNEYEGAAKDAVRLENPNPIISIGGHIFLEEVSSITLPCETISNLFTNIQWKISDKGRNFIDSLIENNEVPNVKRVNNSLIISPVDNSFFTCQTDSDSIEYRLTVNRPRDSSPKTPIIDDFRVTENSIFIRWKSRGSIDISAPITGFVISWTNRYTNESMTVKLEEKDRSFYLNNVTCGSDFIIKLSSQSYNGNSKTSEIKSLRTLGSSPVFADSKALLPQKNIETHSANFNLLSFGPGNNCSAIHFTIEIGLTIHGRDDEMDCFHSKNISIHELLNKCCYKVSDLNPSTVYKYRITAFNPAGSVHTYGTFETLAINGVHPGYRQHGTSTSGFGNQSWLLMIILIIVIIFILIIVVVGVLYIWRSKEKKSQTITTKVTNRKTDFNQNRIEKERKAEDTVSMDSEPSPYAVYQPDIDPKMGQMRSQQIPPQNSAPLYNYTDHHYNHIRYDKIPLRRQVVESNNHDYLRRSNSAECLSSLGNASVAGIADLESPNNIDPSAAQDYFRAPFNHCTDNDEVFQNLQRPDFSTVNKTRIRRESEHIRRYNDDDTSMLMKHSANQIAMERSRCYETNNARPKPRQLQGSSGNSNHHNYRTQMSVPEPTSLYQQQYSFPSNRLRSTSGTVRNHPSSQTTVLPSSNGSSAQFSGYGSYYGHRGNNMPIHQISSGIGRDIDQTNNHYSSHKDGSNQSNYNPPSRTVVARPALETLDSPDEGIYTDRVVVV